MNANDSLERGIADVYEREAPPRAPDWVLASVLDAIDTTPQRRVLIPAPWRFRHMNTFAKAAIAAVVVIAIGAVGLTMFSPRNSSVGGQPSASPSVSPSSSAAVSPTADPSAPPPLSPRFESTVHGYSIAYPESWETRAATERWNGSGLNFPDAPADVLFDSTLADHLFLLNASRPLGAQSPQAWIETIRNEEDGGCGQPETIDVGGADARLCPGLAYVAAGGRGYVFRLYTSGDEGWIERYYDTAWFKSVLDTVRLDPASAVDAAASPSS